MGQMTPTLDEFRAFLDSFATGTPARYMEVVADGVILHCEWGTEEHLVHDNLPVSVVLRDGPYDVPSVDSDEVDCLADLPRSIHAALAVSINRQLVEAGFGPVRPFRFRPKFSGETSNFEFEGVVRNNFADTHAV